MILATMKGSIDLVKCLLEKGSNINEENHEGETPLHLGIIQKLIFYLSSIFLIILQHHFVDIWNWLNILFRKVQILIQKMRKVIYLFILVISNFYL